ncbi:hypothetical protein AtubIFM57258_002854 [Aspergillus tubingensis]|nr:hypothetical protein AtubIFM57258_002854 [Aspergillus tubingensis]
MKAGITHRILPKRLLSLALGSPLGQGAQVNDAPIPSITDNEVLVKVHAVALNPIDFKDIDFISPRDWEWIPRAQKAPKTCWSLDSAQTDDVNTRVIICQPERATNLQGSTQE